MAHSHAHRRSGSVVAAALLAVVALVLAACSSAGTTAKANSSGLVTVRIGYDTGTASSALAWLASESGLLKQYGIQPKMEALASASITQALIGGSIDIAYASSVTIPTAVEKGAKLVVLGASYQGPIFSVVGNPSIKGLAGLKGKKLGTTQVGSTTYVLAEQLIQSVGLKPNKDVTLVPVGSNAASIAALKSGELDAAVLSEPATTQAIDSGASMIYNQADSGVKSVGWVISVRRAYLSANKDTITKFLKADIATVHFMKAEPDKAAPLLSGLLDTSDPSVLSGSLAAMNRITENALQIPTDDYTAKIAVAAASDPGLKNLELSSFVDTSLVDQIVASGFVQSLGPDPSSSAAAPSAPAASPSAP